MTTHLTRPEVGSTFDMTPDSYIDTLVTVTESRDVPGGFWVEGREADGGDWYSRTFITDPEEIDA
jgi:hypothetical protein